MKYSCANYFRFIIKMIRSQATLLENVIFNNDEFSEMGHYFHSHTFDDYIVSLTRLAKDLQKTRRLL